MRKPLISLMVLVLIGLSSSAFAQANEGWYVGVSAGSTNQVDACDEVDDPPFVVFTGSCDDTDTGWKIFAGKQFNKNWGLELGYADLGVAEASGTLTEAPSPPVAASADREAKAVYVAGTGAIPFGKSQKFALFAKLGAVGWDVDLDVSIPAQSGSETGASALLGFGVKYDFTQRIGIRGEWERFFAVGDDEETGQSDVDLITIGVVVWF